MLYIIYDLYKIIFTYTKIIYLGKIGSGFDIAAAVYGTQIYHRFPAKILEGCFNSVASNDVTSQSGSGNDVTDNLLRYTVETDELWADMRIQSFILPNKIRYIEYIDKCISLDILLLYSICMKIL